MNKCKECESKANWVCPICNVVLCSTHKSNHNLKKPIGIKQKVLDSVTAKVCLIDQFSHQLTNISNIIVEQLSILSKAIASQLEDQRNRYLKILRLLETEIVEDQLIILEREAAEVLVYEKSRDMERWYEQEIIKEGVSASNRGEEYLQFGRDLIQEALNITQICLETSNVYAGGTGTIKGSDFIYKCKTDKIEEYNFIYHGEIENGLRHGRGKCSYSTGDFYSGEFKNGKREGTGVYQCSSGNAYDGEWKSGMKEGRGIYKWNGRDEYDGEWKANMKEGRGIYKWSNGNVYDGEWKASRIEGKGLFKWSDGDLYYGHLKAGIQEGRGVYKYDSGDLCCGEFKDGKLEGRAVYRSVKHGIYDGEWKADLKEGRGVKMHASGEIYDGEWKADLREGRGVNKYASGEIYDGEWKADLREGRGVNKFASVDIYDGEWKAGKRCREDDKSVSGEADNEEGKTEKRKC